MMKTAPKILTRAIVLALRWKICDIAGWFNQNDGRRSNVFLSLSYFAARPPWQTVVTDRRQTRYYLPQIFRVLGQVRLAARWTHAHPAYRLPRLAEST